MYLSLHVYLNLIEMPFFTSMNLRQLKKVTKLNFCIRNLNKNVSCSWFSLRLSIRSFSGRWWKILETSLTTYHRERARVSLLSKKIIPYDIKMIVKKGRKKGELSQCTYFIYHSTVSLPFSCSSVFPSVHTINFYRLIGRLYFCL